jgi:hypothetical protein
VADTVVVVVVVDTADIVDIVGIVDIVDIAVEGIDHRDDVAGACWVMQDQHTLRHKPVVVVVVSKKKKKKKSTTVVGHNLTYNQWQQVEDPKAWHAWLMVRPCRVRWSYQRCRAPTNHVLQ